MEIIKITTEHLQQLQKISYDTFYETFKDQNSEENMATYLKTAFTEEKLLKEMKHPHAYFYFAMLEGEVAGYLKLNVSTAQSEEMGEDTLEIERIYVKRSYQKHGVGKSLYLKSVEVAQKLQKSKIWLGVWEKNENAIAFYEKQGFLKTGSHTFMMGDEKQLDYIMVKQIL